MAKRFRKKLRPYRQGKLDGLCGHYAIINGLRMACRSLPNSPSVRWKRLSAALFSDLESRGELYNTLTDGMSTRGLLRNLNVAKEILKAKHGIVLTVTTPWKKHEGRRSKRHWTELSKSIQKPGQSVILGFSTKLYDHWSVIRKVGDTSIHLADSDGVSKLKIAAVRIVVKFRRPSSREIHIPAQDLILISLVE